MNNLLHLKYAVEIERTGSISKAAANLYMGQPQLSKALRELEDSLGSPVFDRTPRGVVPTERGREFLVRAKNIIAQVAEMEALYKSDDAGARRFGVSVPRAEYISKAFADFAAGLDPARAVRVSYRETNSVRAIKNVADSVDNIAVIRCRASQERYFRNMLAERGLAHREICDFSRLALMSASHALARETRVTPDMLAGCVELVYGDASVPSLPPAERSSPDSDANRTVAIYERGSLYELLCRIPSAYILTSPVPDDTLRRFSLVQLRCDADDNRCKDLLVYRSGYSFNSYDDMFVKILNAAADEIVNMT